MEITNKTPVIIAALITAVCVLGDAMLFIVLPVYYRDFGLTDLWQVGVLLSINRFIRLPINPLVGWYYSKMSKRSGILLAVFLAMLTTFSYGWVQNFWLLLIVRCAWGIAWAFLRLGGLLTVVQSGSGENRGQLMGLYNGLCGLGGLIGMLTGGLMADLIGIQSVTIVFSLMALLCIPLVFRYFQASVIDMHEQSTSEDKNNLIKKSLWKSPNLPAVMFSGFVIQLVIMGVFASTLSRMISVQLSSTTFIFGFGIGAATIAGIIQAIRWGWDPFLAPFVGRLSDRKWRREPFLMISIFGGALFFALIPYGLTLFSLLVFLLGFQLMSTIMITLTDSLISDVASRKSKVKVMTAYTITVDIGTALGPLTGYLIIDWIGIYSLYWISSGLLSIVGYSWYSILRK